MCKLSDEYWPSCWSSLGAEGRLDPSMSLGGKGFQTPSEVLVTGWVKDRLALTAMGLWPCTLHTVSGCAGSAVTIYFSQPKLSYLKKQKYRFSFVITTFFKRLCSSACFCKLFLEHNCNHMPHTDSLKHARNFLFFSEVSKHYSLKEKPEHLVTFWSLDSFKKWFSVFS